MIFGPYPGRVDAVHDGDSIYVDLDLGFDHFINAHDFDGHPRMMLRVLGINSPELQIGGRPNQAGVDARDFASTLLPRGTRIWVTSHGWDAYSGRFDGEIRLSDGSDFAARMVDAGHAVRKTYR